MQHCTRCSAELDEGLAFCGECGQGVDRPPVRRGTGGGGVARRPSGRRPRGAAADPPSRRRPRPEADTGRPSGRRPRPVDAAPARRARSSRVGQRAAQAPAAGRPIACPGCDEILDADAAFCEQCGHRLVAGVPRRRSGRRLGSLAVGQHVKQIKHARVALVVVAIVVALEAFASGYLFDEEVRKLRRTHIIDSHKLEAAREQMRLIQFSMFVAAGIFVGCYFWAGTRPFAASVTGLVLFIGLKLVAIAIDPTNIARGWILTLIVLSVLGKGIQASMAVGDAEAGLG